MAFMNIYKSLKNTVDSYLRSSDESSQDISPDFNKLNIMNGEIQQGRKYLKTRKMEVDEYMKAHEQNNIRPNQISGYSIEGFENIDNESYDKSLQKLVQSEISDIKDMESKFQELLSKYSAMHTQFMNDALQFVNLKNNKYNGKILITPSNKKYYITNYGIAREMSDALFEKRHKSCSNVQNVNNEDLTTFGLTYGSVMDSVIPCGFEGKNIIVPGIDYNTGSGDKSITNDKVVYKTKDYIVKYLGCYADFGVNDKGVNNRTLPNRLPGGDGTFEELVQKAIAGNYRYLGLQYGQGSNWEKAQGWGGNTTRFQNYTRPLYSDPNITSGDLNRKYYCKFMKNSKDIYAGGSWTNAVYEIVMQGKAGYVNEDTILNPYSNGKVDNTTETCPTNVETIDEDTWKLFQQGENMAQTTLCNLGKIEPEVRNTLQSLYTQLISMATKIQNKITSANELIQKISNKSAEEKQKLENDVNHFKTLLNDFSGIRKRNPTIDAILEDSKLKFGMDNYEYMGYTVLTILLLFLIMKYAR
jgi:hypothetical protein